MASVAVVVLGQVPGGVLVFVGLPGVLGIVVVMGVGVVIAMLVRVAVLVQVVVTVGVRVRVAVLDRTVAMRVAVHMGVLMTVVVLVFVAVPALVAAVHDALLANLRCRPHLSRLPSGDTQSHNRATSQITTRTSSMMLSRILPAVAVALAALPAAAHSIGVDHSHAALDSSVVLGVVLAVAGLGAWWAKNR